MSQFPLTNSDACERRGEVIPKGNNSLVRTLDEKTCNASAEKPAHCARITTVGADGRDERHHRCCQGTAAFGY